MVTVMRGEGTYSMGMPSRTFCVIGWVHIPWKMLKSESPTT